MTDLEDAVRASFSAIADEARPVDLRARVAATRRRRTARRRLAVGASALAVAGVTVGVSLLGMPLAPDREDDLAGPSGPTDPPSVTVELPVVLDLTPSRAVTSDDRLRLLVQVEGGDGATRTYGLLARAEDGRTVADQAAGDHVVEVLDVGPLGGDPVFGLPAVQLTLDGTRALVPGDGPDGEAVVVDLRTGRRTVLPSGDDRDPTAVGLAPEGDSVVYEVVGGEAFDSGPTEAGRVDRDLVVLELASGKARTVPADPPLTWLDGAAGHQPVWVPDGSAVQTKVGVGGFVSWVLVDVATGVANDLGGTPLAGAASWSPGGDQVVLMGGSEESFVVVGARPDGPGFAEIAASGPVLGRTFLGWAADDELLWWDQDDGTLVGTDLEGDVRRTTDLAVDGEVLGMQLVPVVR